MEDVWGRPGILVKLSLRLLTAGLAQVIPHGPVALVLLDVDLALCIEYFTSLVPDHLHCPLG